MASTDPRTDRPDPTPIGLLHLVGLLDWQPPQRCDASSVTVRPGRWVVSDAGRVALAGARG